MSAVFASARAHQIIATLIEGNVPIDQVFSGLAVDRGLEVLVRISPAGRGQQDRPVTPAPSLTPAEQAVLDAMDRKTPRKAAVIASKSGVHLSTVRNILPRLIILEKAKKIDGRGYVRS